MSDFVSRYSAVIFDLDGTLVDSERLMVDAGVTALVRLGFPARRDLLVGLVGTVNVPGHPTMAAALGPTFDADAFNAEWDREIDHLFAGTIPLRPGAQSLLQTLAGSGIPVALATNSTTASARAKLANAGIDHFFAKGTVMGRDKVSQPKPAPDMFLLAAEKLGHAPARCLVFEDSDAGTAAALAAGIDVVQIPDQRPPGSDAATLIAPSLLQGAQQMGLIAPSSA